MQEKGDLEPPDLFDGSATPSNQLTVLEGNTVA